MKKYEVLLTNDERVIVEADTYGFYNGVFEFLVNTENWEEVGKEVVATFASIHTRGVHLIVES